MYWKINSNRLIEFKKNAKNLLNHGTNCFFVPPENFVLLKNNVTRTEDLHCLSNELKRDSSFAFLTKSGTIKGRNSSLVVQILSARS